MARRRRPGNTLEAVEEVQAEATAESPALEVAAEAEVAAQAEVAVEAEPQVEETQDEPDFGDSPGVRLRQAFYERARNFLELLQLAREQLSPTNVHQLRVASRRLDAALQLMRTLLGKGPCRKLRGDIKEVRSSLSDLRDLQQQLEWLSEEPLMEELLTSRAAELPKKIRKASKKLAGYKPSRFEKKLELVDALLAALLEEEDAEANIQQMLSQQIWETLLGAMARAEQVDPDVSFTYHPLRLAMKAFRYQSEVYRDAGWPCRLDEEEGWEKVKELHQSLGRLQDIEVLCCHLDQFWSEIPPIRETQARIVNRLLKDRHQMLGQIHLQDLDWERLWEWPEGEIEEIAEMIEESGEEG